MPPLDPLVLEMLACPVCRVKVTAQGDRLACGQCGRRYPVRDGIPVMLADQAEMGAPEAR